MQYKYNFKTTRQVLLDLAKEQDTKRMEAKTIEASIDHQRKRDVLMEAERRIRAIELTGTTGRIPENVPTLEF